MKKCVVKRCLLDMTRPLHAQSYSHYGYLHNIHMTSGPLTSPLLMGEGLGRYYPSTRGDSYGGEEVVSFTTATLQEQPPILFTHARTNTRARTHK